MRRRYLSMLLLPFAFCTNSSDAQDLPDVAQGLQPYVAYHGGELDQVSTINGGLTVRIPLVSYPQKGSLSLSYSLIFNSFSFQDVSICDATPNPTGPIDTIPVKAGCTNRIRLTPTGTGDGYPIGPRLIADQELSAGGNSEPEFPFDSSQPPVWGRFYVIGPDNSEHPLAPASGGYRSIDQAGYLFVPTSAPSVSNGNLGVPEGAYPGDTATMMSRAPGTITGPNGVVYTSTSITDPDGNSISLPNGGVLGPSRFSSGLPATDSTGRIIPDVTTGNMALCPVVGAQFQPVTSASSWAVPGPGGSVSYLFCFASVNIYTHFVIGSTSNGNSEFVRTVSMLQSVVLPNGTFWGFIYDSNDPSSSPVPTLNNLNVGTGQLMTLIYPTGGRINYTYGVGPGACDSGRPNGLNPAGAALLAYTPQIATRTMADAQGNTLGTWTYGLGTILSPDGNLTTTNFDSDPNAPYSCPTFDAGQLYYKGSSTSGTLLKSVAKTYTFVSYPGQPYASYPQETATTTTLANGSTSSVQSVYSNSLNFSYIACDYHGLNCANSGSYSIPLGIPTTKKYIDFSGSTLKQETTTYQWQMNSAYLTANQINLPAVTKVLDSSGYTSSQTTYSYDESSYSPGGTRGHNTTATRTLLTSGVSPTVHTGWNASGEKSFIIDADAAAGIGGHLNSYGHSTDYQYSSNSALSCNGSLVTSTVNALNQVVYGNYDCGSGLLTSFVDANSQTTGVSWDSMKRLHVLTYPSIAAGTPTTTFNYSDATNIVTRTTIASPDPTQTLQVSFDGFGREIHRTTYDTPQNDTVDTTYDGNGRVASVSNPYRSTGDLSYGVTTYTYDALNRKIIETEPDSSRLVWCYDGVNSGSVSGCYPSARAQVGSWVDNTDEIGNHWQRVQDGLGRLIAVIEPNPAGSKGLETDYVYTSLDNLKSVTQIGNASAGEVARNRSFNYDSLSRLLTSTNPETGTVCYGVWNAGSCNGGYDPNGNLLSKTDARNVPTQYGYDGLNRLTSTTAPGINYAYIYDQGTNGVGRLSYASNSVNAEEVFSYDAMGEMISQGSWTPSSPDNTGIVTSAKYDLAGHVTDLTYPDGRHITQQWDSAAHLMNVIFADWNGQSVNYPYASNISYLPTGAPSQITLGNGVIQTYSLNSRLQDCEIKAVFPTAPGSSTTQPSFDKQYYFSSVSGTGCGAVSGNNGNIASVNDVLNSGRTQSFHYDSLNRLTSAVRTDGGFNYSYPMDSFGNMYQVNNLTGNPAISFPFTNNQMQVSGGVWSYDAAGNLIGTGQPANGGSSFTFDSEGQMTQVNSGSTATYTYDAEGQRIRKDLPSNWTEYIYFGGQPIAEKNANGSWSDYIFANGQRIAQADSFDERIHLGGTTTQTGQYAAWYLPFSNYVIAAGDKIQWRQFQQGGARGGVGIAFTDGTNTNWNTYDSSGALMNSDPTQNAWHERSVDLSSFANKTANKLFVVTDAQTAAGTWNNYFDDMAIVSLNGTVTPIYHRQTAIGFSYYTGGGIYCPRAFVETSNSAGDAEQPQLNTTYYAGDNLGTARMQFAGGGWPVWQGDFAPYGEEINAQQTPNHYKFTGKERDAESGLDYFGARYYGSSMGRWMSPDWSAKQEPVPYAKLENPQSLNLYSYVLNSPLVHRDLDGHIIDETGLDKNKQYQKWKKNYLSHEGAQKQWNALNDNKNLTVHMSWDSKGSSSVTSGYQWDKGGNLTSVNVSLAGKTGDTSNSMSASSGYIHGSTLNNDGAMRQAYVFAHEFAHVEYADTQTGGASIRNDQIMGQHIQDMYKQFGPKLFGSQPGVEQMNQQLQQDHYDHEQGADQRAWEVIGSPK